MRALLDTLRSKNSATKVGIAAFCFFLLKGLGWLVLTTALAISAWW